MDAGVAPIANNALLREKNQDDISQVFAKLYGDSSEVLDQKRDLAPQARQRYIFGPIRVENVETLLHCVRMTLLSYPAASLIRIRVVPRERPKGGLFSSPIGAVRLMCCSLLRNTRGSPVTRKASRTCWPCQKQPKLSLSRPGCSGTSMRKRICPDVRSRYERKFRTEERQEG